MGWAHAIFTLTLASCALLSVVFSADNETEVTGTTKTPTAVEAAGATEAPAATKPPGATTEGQGPPYRCWLCLGHNMDSCKSGEASCDMGCMKLVDSKNNLIAKGCTDVDKDNGNPHTLERVLVPWDNNAPLSGAIYTCHSEFCNSSPALSFPLIAVLSSILLAALFA